MGARTIKYGGKSWESIRDLTDSLGISYSAVVTGISRGKLIDEVVDKQLAKVAKAKLKDCEYCSKLNSYGLEMLYRQAGMKYHKRPTEDTFLSFRGIEKTLYQWSIITGEPLNKIIHRYTMYKQPSKILGVKTGRWIGDTRVVKGLLTSKEYFRLTNLRKVGDMILDENETIDDEDIYHHPLYSAWRRLNKEGKLCEEWSASYKVFFHSLINHYVRGYGLMPVYNDRLISEDNFKFDRHNKGGAKGVYKNGSKYVVKVWSNGVSIHLGTYDTKEEAKDAYHRHIDTSF
jgi:hypothetical protein